MKNKILNYFILLTLVLLNCFLLYTNVQRQNKINVLEAERSSFERIKSTLLPDTTSVIHPEIKFTEDGIFLLVIIPQSSCASCLEFEVPNINKLSERYKEKVKVIVLGKNKNSLKDYGANFSLQLINPTANVFNTSFNFLNPVAVLTDSSGAIYNSYVAEVGNVEKSNRFYARMDRFLNAVQ